MIVAVWSDRMTLKEFDRTKRAIEILLTVSWAKPLLTRLEKAGGLKPENMPLMFEVRFAHQLYDAGISAVYEYETGVGDSTVEFKTNTSPSWLIELVSVRTSDAARRATRQVGLIYEQLLVPTPENPNASGEAEMITAEQKIGEKVFADGRVTKFPLPTDSLHLIVADMRGYLDEGGDVYDYRQMAYGARGIPRELSWVIHCWQGLPIKGLFEKDNPLRAARYIQERIHFLGFVRERNFHQGEIQEEGVAYYLANPHIFCDQDAALKAFRRYPLPPIIKSR